jgi:hypothetical protein
MPKPSPTHVGFDQIVKDRLDQILEDRVAKRRFDRLIKLRAIPEVLAKWFTLIPQMDTRRGPLVSGIGDRTMRKLPHTIEAMARTLQQVNESRISPAEVLPGMPPIKYLTTGETFAVGSSVNNWVGAGIHGQKATVFRVLPQFLRDYATCLRFLIGLAEHKQLKTINGFQYSEEQVGVLSLLGHIEATTGEPHFTAVADLLRAAFEKAGVTDSRRMDGISVEALRKLWHRKPFLRLLVAQAQQPGPARKSLT